MLRKILRLWRTARKILPRRVEISGLEPRVLFTSVPSAPTNLTATSSSSQIQLHWRDNSTNETGFDIYRGTSKTNLTKVGSVAKNTTWFNQSPPAKNTTYYYTVRAYDSAGVSAATAAVSGKISTSSVPTL